MLVIMCDYKAVNCSLHSRMSESVKYGRWEAEDVKRVLEAFRNSNIGLNAVSHKYSVPKATLKRHLDGKNYFAVENTQVMVAWKCSPTCGRETS